MSTLEQPAAEDVTLSVQAVATESGCELQVSITAFVFIPAFFPGDEDGNQVAQYDYIVHETDGIVSGSGTLHLEFQTVTGKIEDPCTEPIGIQGTQSMP